MVAILSTCKVQLILWALLIASTHSDKIKGRLPDLGIISSFLEQFIRPYIQSIQVNDNVPRANEESKIEKVIRLKIASLKPLLQDDDTHRPRVETENNLTLEGNDETTIIEFLPKPSVKRKNRGKMFLREVKTETDSFQKNIIKYKQLRKSIKNILDKERTASTTKNLITRTLDEMIAQLIGSQCTWKVGDTTDIKDHLFKGPKNARKSMQKLHKLSNKEWMTLRKQYLNFLKFNDGKDDEFLKQFHDFFSNVINDTSNLSHRYKVRCQLVKVTENDPPKQYLREDKMVDKNQCDSFKVCSGEMKDFLVNFYTYLNDTAVSTFRNYAAMYVRDVNADIGLDKDIVVSVIENLSNTAEKKVNRIFRKELDRFTLDENKKKGANIQHINDFITSTADQVKRTIKKSLDYELGAMKTKLFTTVKEDLNVNLKVDMDNLSRLFVDRICALFVLCNGKYPARRLDKPWTFKPKDTENIYVKVQLTLDDELKESIARVGHYAKPWKGPDMTHRFVKNFAGVDEKKYTNISVTRTSLSTFDTTMSTNSTSSTTSTTTTTPVKQPTTTSSPKPQPIKEIIGSSSVTILVKKRYLSRCFICV